MASRREKRKILCVSWDPHLAKTRRLILAAKGYAVESALGQTQAIEFCTFMKADLLVLGHSVPRDQKRLFVDMFRRSNKAPVLSLLSSNQDKLPDVEFGVEFMDPTSLVKTVNSILQ